MDLPKIYPITPETETFEKLLTQITALASKNLSVFQYRRKILDKSQVKQELDLLEPIISEFNITFDCSSATNHNILTGNFSIQVTVDLNMISFD